MLLSVRVVDALPDKPFTRRPLPQLLVECTSGSCDGVPNELLLSSCSSVSNRVGAHAPRGTGSDDVDRITETEPAVAFRETLHELSLSDDDDASEAPWTRRRSHFKWRSELS